MAASWTDPADLTPDARRVPRTVSAWRSYDPLRRMLGHPRSGIEPMHILAADMLREQVDLALLGFSATRPLIYVQQFSQPRWGLGPDAVKQMRAVRSLRRVALLYQPPQLLMIEAIILRNTTLRQWSMSRVPASPVKIEKQRLMVVLDRLATHYDGEIMDDLAKGRRLPP